MKVIQEKEIRKLRREGAVTNETGERLNRASLQKTQKTISTEEKQVRALEDIGKRISILPLVSEKNSMVLLEAIRKIDTPEQPQPVLRWKHTISRRDSDGRTKEIISEAIR